MKRALTAFIASIILCVEICSAKSVGVVMSGGGAKGLYHIGVLAALEQSGVPIDYVAGTSMGAIIAGLYAAGYSPSEMRMLALSGELEKWASGKINRSLGAYVRRGSTLYRENPNISIRLDPKSSDSVTRMPKSLISTTQIDMAMVRLFSPASAASGNDFSKLMVPFLCVASDITDNKGVVLTSGDLGKSIRASMAIPLAFKPIVDENEHILYDGGMYDNFPWRHMRKEFDPDLIIGSVCGVDSWTNTKDLSIADQAFLLAMEPTDYDITGNSVIVKRDVPVGMLDFSKASESIRLGYMDTLTKIDDILSQFSPEELKDADYYNQRREAFRDKSPKLIFNSYGSTGLGENQRNYAQKFMAISKRDLKLGGDEQSDVSYNELSKNLFRVLSENEFNTNYPDVHYDPTTERYKFEIGMESKPSLELALSGNLSSTQFNQIYLSVSYKNIKRAAQNFFGELYLGPAYTAGRLGYRADFYLRTPMFVDSYFNFAVKNLDHGNFGHLTHIDNALGMKSAEPLLSVGVGVPIGQHSITSIRTNVGSSIYKYSNGQPTDASQLASTGFFNRSLLNYGAAKFKLERSTINNLHYPTDGSLISLSAIGVVGYEKSFSESFTAAEDEPQNLYQASRRWIGAKATLSKYYNTSYKRNFIIGVSGEAVYTNIPEMCSTTASILYMPSYTPVAHTQMVYMPEFSAPRYAAAGIMPSVKLWSDVYFQTQFYAMFRDEFDPETYRVSDGGDYCVQYISQASFTYESNFGPASLSLTKYNINSWDNLYVMFNFGYPLFAPKGIFY